MIKFEDYDSNEQEEEKPYTLPERIDSITVSHDGGRLEILINGKQVLKRSSGTRDCSVYIVRDSESK